MCVLILYRDFHDAMKEKGGDGLLPMIESDLMRVVTPLGL